MRIRTKTMTGGWTLIEIMIVVSMIGLLAGISVPNLFKARDATYLNTIQSNLRLIDDIKEQWALEHGAGPGFEPIESDLVSYFKGNTMPYPVVGETYSINALGTSASATIPVAVGSWPAGSDIVLY